MKKLQKVLLCLLALMLILCVPQFAIAASAEETQEVSAGREERNFNRSWKFVRRDEENAMQADYNGNNWYNVGLPHDFSIPYFQETKHYTGIGWYRTGEKLMSLSLENCSVQLRSAVQELKPQMDALLEADEADQEEVRETLQKAKTLIAEINSQNQEKDPDSALQKPDQTLQNPADTDPANEKPAAAQAEKTDSAKNSTQPAKSVKTAAFFGTGMLLSVSAGAMLLATALRKRQKA